VPGYPHGGGYSFTLQEVKLLTDNEAEKHQEKPVPADPVQSDNNIALSASVKVSSFRGKNKGEAAVDGVISAYDVPTLTEWVSTESAGAWIELSWEQPVTVEEIWLFSRKWDSETVIRKGLLEFSDGSSVEVNEIPRAGRREGLSIKFKPKTISGLRFTITECRGSNVGLSEIAVFRKEVVIDI
jgi:hypothetical protein